MSEQADIFFTDEQQQLLEIAEIFSGNKSPMDAVRRQLEVESSIAPELWREIADLGWLGIAIPEEYGGVGTGVTEASIILEEVHRSGGNAAACHAQMYIMGTLLRHGSPEQKAFYLPRIASGELRLQAFGVTAPDAGTDTTSIRTTATREGDAYVVRGQKIWTSRALYSDLMLLLARTTPKDQVKKKTEGLSVFLIDLKSAVGKEVTIEPIETMLNHQTTRVYFDDLRIPSDSLIGEEGKGFIYQMIQFQEERLYAAAAALKGYENIIIRWPH